MSIKTDQEIRELETFTHEVLSEAYFLNTKITIKELADKVSIPVYRVRKMIIEDMGFANFKAFLNFHRIELVKEELTKEENRYTPIKTIAYQCGFESPESCFRAFKAHEGITPKHYRDAHFASLRNLQVLESMPMSA